MIPSLNELGFLMKSRLAQSFSTFPSNSDWILTIALLLIFPLIVVPLGFRFKFLKVEIPKISLRVLLRVALVSLFFPAMAEEALFRVLLLPHKAEQASLASQLLFGSISLALFIIYHPLNATFFIKSAKTTFSSFAFLTSAAILGIVCSIAYFKSGSIYPPIILHWIFVLGWILCLGGYQRLHNQSDDPKE
jgi:predicted Abi (CAAX) family protease